MTFPTFQVGSRAGIAPSAQLSEILRVVKMHDDSGQNFQNGRALSFAFRLFLLYQRHHDGEVNFAVANRCSLLGVRCSVVSRFEDSSSTPSPLRLTGTTR